MNYENYKVKSPLPNKQNYLMFYVYNQGKVLYAGPKTDSVAHLNMTISEIKSKYTTEEVLNKDEYTEAVNDHRKEQKNAILRFKLDLFDEFNIIDSPKAQKAYDIAWNRGHSSGLTAVYDDFAELAPLITNFYPIA